jgi:uncharacterized membrane protein YcaP (DUF421 family)
VLNGIVAIFILVILEIIISVLTMKSLKIRKIMSGNSAVVIKNGVIDQKMLKKVRLTVMDLIELLRGQGYFKVDNIAYAILEVNGSLSVVEKSKYRPVQTGDLKQIKVEKATLPLPVISDGRIISESLKALDVTPFDLEQLIFPTLPKDVFLMTLDRYGEKEIILKEENK